MKAWQETLRAGLDTGSMGLPAVRCLRLLANSFRRLRDGRQCVEAIRQLVRVSIHAAAASGSYMNTRDLGMFFPRMYVVRGLRT